MPLIPSQQAAIDRGDLIRVTVLPGKTVRGTTYFREIELLLSPALADYYIAESAVRRYKLQ